MRGRDLQRRSRRAGKNWTRKNDSARLKAAAVLAMEVSECVLSRVGKRFEVEEVLVDEQWRLSNPVKYMDLKSWTLFNGSIAITVSPQSDGAHLTVENRRYGFSEFRHHFKLCNTDSPRRVAHLLIAWIKRWCICNVMME